MPNISHSTKSWIRSKLYFIYLAHMPAWLAWQKLVHFGRAPEKSWSFVSRAPSSLTKPEWSETAQQTVTNLLPVLEDQMAVWLTSAVWKRALLTPGNQGKSGNNDGPWEMPPYHPWPTFSTLLRNLQMPLEETNSSFPPTVATFQFLLTPSSLARQEPMSHQRGGKTGKVTSEWEKNCLCRWKGRQRQSHGASLLRPVRSVLSAPLGEGNRGWKCGKGRYFHAWIYHVVCGVCT